MAVTNRQVVQAARELRPAEGVNLHVRRGCWGTPPPGLRDWLDQERQHITLTVVSYSTPVMWFHEKAQMWFVTPLTYSVTTSGKHVGPMRAGLAARFDIETLEVPSWSG